MALTACLKDGRFADMRFRTFGCAPAIAAGSLLTEALKHTEIDRAKEWTVERLLEALGGLPEDKVHCAQLAIEALKSLLEGIREPLRERENSVDTDTGQG